MRHRHPARILITALLCIAVLMGALTLAAYVRDSAAAQSFVYELGYVGVLLLAIIAGLNVIVPVPAATFTAVFTTAGLSLPIIIVMLVIGTLIADLIGYIFGRYSREHVSERYPKSMQYAEHLVSSHTNLVVPFVFLFAAFVPFPNEAMVIPLALVGVKFQSLILPLLLGTIVHQSLFAYGVENIFGALF